MIVMLIDSSRQHSDRTIISGPVFVTSNAVGLLLSKQVLELYFVGFRDLMNVLPGEHKSHSNQHSLIGLTGFNSVPNPFAKVKINILFCLLVTFYIYLPVITVNYT